MCISQIEIRKDKAKNGDEYLYVKTPYSSEFVKEARKLNGSWVASQKEWAFDPRDADKVREVCRRIYGTDGLSVVGELVTARLHLDKLSFDNKIEYFGRSLAYRPYRDSYVRLDNSAVIIQGGFPKHGGSAKYPMLNPETGTILEIRDVPESIVHPENFPENSIEVLPNDKKVNVQVLKEEAIAIRKRLTEILEILAKEGEDV